MPIIAVLSANAPEAPDFEWIGEADDVLGALASLCLELGDVSAEELLGAQVRTGLDQAQADALIDWIGGAGAPEAFPAGLPALTPVSRQDVAHVLGHPEAVAQGACRF